MVPNSSLDAPAASDTPAASPDDTAGYFSTTSPRSKSASTVSWNTQPHASPSGTSALAAQSSGPLPYATVAGYVYYCGGGYSEGSTTEPTSNTSNCGPGLYGWLAFALHSNCCGGSSGNSPVTVGYQLGGSTVGPNLPAATPGVDYTGPLVDAGSVTLSPDTTAFMYYRASADNAVEGMEEVRAVITDGAGYTGGSAGSTVIYDNPPVVSILATDDLAGEPSQPGSGGLAADPGTFTFRRTGGDLGSALSVDYDLAAPTPGGSGVALNGVDYETLSGTVDFAAGEIQKTVTVMPKHDFDREGQEAVQATIVSHPGRYLIDAGTATITVADNPYTVTVGSEQLTVGFTKQVPVTVLDADGYPAVNVGLTVEPTYDADVIEPQQQSVSTDAQGHAVLDVKALDSGSSPLVLAMVPSPATKGQGNQQAGPATVIPSPIEGFAGQVKTSQVLVLDQNNMPVVGAHITASIVETNGEQVAGVVQTTDATDSNGKVSVSVVLHKSTANGQPLTLKVTLKEDATAVGTTPITVKKVYIQATAALALSSDPTAPNHKGDIIVTVTDAAVNGNPVPGVSVFAIDLGTPNDVVGFDPSDSIDTDQNGRRIFHVFGNILPPGVNTASTDVQSAIFSGEASDLTHVVIN